MDAGAILTAMDNHAHEPKVPFSNRLVLTLIGSGVFRVPLQWILLVLRDVLTKYLSTCGIEVVLNVFDPKQYKETVDFFGTKP